MAILTIGVTASFPCYLQGNTFSFIYWIFSHLMSVLHIIFFYCPWFGIALITATGEGRSFLTILKAISTIASTLQAPEVTGSPSHQFLALLLSLAYANSLVHVLKLQLLFPSYNHVVLVDEHYLLLPQLPVIIFIYLDYIYFVPMIVIVLLYADDWHHWNFLHGFPSSELLCSTLVATLITLIQSKGEGVVALIFPISSWFYYLLSPFSITSFFVVSSWFLSLFLV